MKKHRHYITFRHIANQRRGGGNLILTMPGWKDLPLCILVAFVAAFAIWKHKSNIQRLMKGCENKIY